MSEKPMIEVILSTGDRGEAPDFESAKLCARTLVNDHWNAMPVQGRGRGMTVTFIVGGQHVQTIEARRLT